jgi:hypothetical protein
MLAGKRIGVIANTGADYFADMYLELQGIDSSQATREDPVVFAKVWQVSDFTLALNQSLLSVPEDETRWALAGRATAPAAPPNVLELIDARPLQSAVPGAVSILHP